MLRRQDQGIVLHVRAYRESSAIVSLLSREYGLIRGVLKGYKGSGKAGKYSSVRPLSLANFSFSGTGELKTLFNMELIRSFSSRPDMLSYSMVLVEICHRLLPAEQEESEVFETLSESLRMLDAANTSGPECVTRFILAFLLIQGYELEKTSAALDHLMTKSENAALSKEERQVLLEQSRGLLNLYFPNKVIKSFNLLLGIRNETRS
jgi:DNA repair protein RecO (recombination protein O)